MPLHFVFDPNVAPVIFGFIYGATCTALSPIWIRNYRLREAKKMIKLCQGMQQNISKSPRLNAEFEELFYTFSMIETNLMSKEPGIKGFFQHGIGGLKEISGHHSEMRSRVMLLKARLRLVQSEIRSNLIKSITTQEPHACLGEFRLILNQSSLLEGSSECDRISQMQYLLQKMTELKFDPEILEQVQTMCVAREASYVLETMNRESIEDLHSFTGKAVWKDEVATT